MTVLNVKHAPLWLTTLVAAAVASSGWTGSSSSDRQPGVRAVHSVSNGKGLDSVSASLRRDSHPRQHKNPTPPTTTTTPSTSTTVVTTLPPATTTPATTPPATTAPAAVTPPVTTAPPTTPPPTTAPPTTPPPTTTSPPTTTVPPTTTTLPPAAFPTAQTAGVPAGVTLVPWTGAWRSSQATGMPTRVVDGQTYKVFSGYLFDSGTSGNYFYVDDPYVLFENVRFTTSGQVSNTSAMLQQSSANVGLVVVNSDFDGGPYHQRGIQADYGVRVTSSEFTRFGNAAVEMNNRSGTRSLVVEYSYLYEPKGWLQADHTDGIQVGAGKDITIHDNTVLIQPWGGIDGDNSYVSNSALGLWAELGNVTGTVVVQHNRIAGGGRVVYLQQKSPYAWQGSVTVADNVFDQYFTSVGGVWGPLYPGGLPSQLTWTNNTWSNGTTLTLQDALTKYP